MTAAIAAIVVSLVRVVDDALGAINGTSELTKVGI